MKKILANIIFNGVKNHSFCFFLRAMFNLILLNLLIYTSIKFNLYYPDWKLARAIEIARLYSQLERSQQFSV